MPHKATGYIGPGHEREEPFRVKRNAAEFGKCQESELIEVEMWQCDYCGYLFKHIANANYCEKIHERDGEVITLSSADWDKFNQALNEPPKDIPRLKKLFQERSPWEK